LTDWSELVRQLDLAPHPKGGWFRETWRSELTIATSRLPPGYTGPRNAGTAILYLLMPGEESPWHTVRSTEFWLYHLGGPLLVDIGSEQHGSVTRILGSDIAAGEQPQVAVPPGYWQRAQPRTTSQAWSAALWCQTSTSTTSCWTLQLAFEQQVGPIESDRGSVETNGAGSFAEPFPMQPVWRTPTPLHARQLDHPDSVAAQATPIVLQEDQVKASDAPPSNPEVVQLRRGCLLTSDVCDLHLAERPVNRKIRNRRVAPRCARSQLVPAWASRRSHASSTERAQSPPQPPRAWRRRCANSTTSPMTSPAH
jgi:predicted cupin superfamily sugar epimerase